MNDLCIGGGGYSGVLFIGALEYIHENKLLDLKNFYGCSIGALLGCLYISGHTPKNILSKFLELELEEIVKYDFSNLSTEHHIIDDSLLDSLIGFLWEHVSEDVTIGEFSDIFSVNVNLYATNVTKNEYTCFNNTQFPQVKLKDAVKASMSIPFLFKPVIIEGDTFVDGCCKNIYGSPPNDIYICGYSIIMTSMAISKTYLTNLFLTMVASVKPRTTFLIECNNNLDPNVYLNLDKLGKKMVIDMYKQGIIFCKNCLMS